jgi:hypothetical protein
MRRIATLFTTLSFALSGLVLSPAHGATESCSGGGTFTITSGVVSAGITCAGVASIPEGVTRIENSAFSDAASLTSIMIPATVTEIGNSAFRFAGLTSITVDPANVDYISIGGVLFNEAVTTIIAYPANKDVTSYSIPETVTTIVNSAFSSANLTSITIPESVTSIGNLAFEFIDVTSINIPASVTSIGTWALYATSSLSNITVDPANSFYSSIGGVLFNEAVTTLIAYPSKRDATSYSIPETVTSIESEAFQSAILTSITIPETVTSIGTYAFENSKLTSVTIPSGVTSIEYGIFYGAGSLTSVTIPSSITSIAADAFGYASSLTNVYFLGDAPANVGTTPFVGTAVGAKAYIKSGASGFGNLGSIWNGLIVTLDVESEDSPEVLAETGIATPTNSLGAIGLGFLAILLGSVGLLRRNQ